jgi:hypothetical protein
MPWFAKFSSVSKNFHDLTVNLDIEYFSTEDNESFSESHHFTFDSDLSELKKKIVVKLQILNGFKHKLDDLEKTIGRKEDVEKKKAVSLGLIAAEPIAK